MSKLIDTIAEAIQDKKGKNIISLDLSGFDGAVCPAFVICNADSTTQVEAIARGIEEKTLADLGEKVWRVEGITNSVWVVMDYGDVLVHIFSDRVARFLQTRTTLGRRSGDPLRIRSVRQYRNGPTVDFLDKSIT